MDTQEHGDPNQVWQEVLAKSEGKWIYVLDLKRVIEGMSNTDIIWHAKRELIDPNSPFFGKDDLIKESLMSRDMAKINQALVVYLVSQGTLPIKDQQFDVLIKEGAPQERVDVKTNWVGKFAERAGLASSTKPEGRG